MVQCKMVLHDKWTVCANLDTTIWTPEQTRQLVNLRHSQEYERNFKTSVYKKMELWKEIGLKLGKSGFECDKKYRYLKKGLL